MTQTTSSRQPMPAGPPSRVTGMPGLPDPRTGAPAPPGGRRAARGADRRRAAVRTTFEGTPGRLRLAGIGAVLACLVLSLLGAAAFQARGNALADARADAAQLIRVQEIATQLVRADSLFTNGYLAYGEETAENLADYDVAISEASSLIAEASRANALDSAALASVNDDLTEYTARVASARENNRQGFQVATGYLRQANVLLRGDAKKADDPTKVVGMLPTLQQLIAANGERVDDAYSSSRLATWMLLGAALLSLGGLIAAQVRLARTTHRYLNVPLVAATGVVLLVLGSGAFIMARAQSSANTVRESSYSDLRSLANARIQGYIAKSAESISLIYIGTGGPSAAAQEQFSTAMNEASQQLNRVPNNPGLTELTAWGDLHKTLYALAGTNWQTAAVNATSADPGTVNTTFDGFNTKTSDALKEQAGLVDSGLKTGRLGLQLLGWIAIVAGVLAAVASWAGISQRLEEYR